MNQSKLTHDVVVAKFKLQMAMFKWIEKNDQLDSNNYLEAGIEHIESKNHLWGKYLGILHSFSICYYSIILLFSCS